MIFVCLLASFNVQNLENSLEWIQSFEDAKLPPRSGCSFEAVEPHPQKGAIKFFKKNYLSEIVHLSLPDFFFLKNH